MALGQGKRQIRTVGRGLGTVGPLVTVLGLFGLSTVTERAPYWQIALWLAIIGGGSGFFNSPNANVLMSAVRPEERGMAVGVWPMLTNTGQMLSIAIAFPLVLAKIPQAAMMQIFLFGGGMGSEPNAPHTFIGGLHAAFILSCLISLVAAAALAAQSAHRRQSQSVLAKGAMPDDRRLPGSARGIASWSFSSGRAYAIERKGGTI